MKISLLLLFEILSVHVLQAKIYQGRVVDAGNKQALAGANVQLYSKKHIYLSGTITDAQGKFSIESKEAAYKITVSYIGFQRYAHTDSLGLPAQMETIPLKAGQELQGVEVKGELRKQDIDKDEYLITDSMRKGTINASQLLDKLPGVRRDWVTEEIRVDGESDVLVIVNGEEKPQDYVLRINPKRIQRVEIQHHPTGRFAGHAVVVNLKLKQDYMGWDLVPNIGGVYVLDLKGAWMSSESIPFTYTKNGWTFYLNPDYTVADIKNVSSLETSYEGKYSKKSDPMDLAHPNIYSKRKRAKVTTGVDYSFSQKHKLSIQLNGTWMDVNDRESYDLTEETENSMRFISQSSSNRYYSDDYTTGLFYMGKWGEKVSVNSNLSYNYYRVKEKRLYQETDVSDNLNNTLGRKDYVNYYLNFYAQLHKKIRLDMDYAMTWRKYNTFDREAHSKLYHSVNKRHRVSATLSYQPVSNFSLRAGMGWNQVGDHSNSGKMNDVSWEPGGWLFWKPFKIVTIRSNYECHTTYPNLDQLSTNSYRTDRWMVHEGNPFLKPSVRHTINNTLSLSNGLRLFYNWNMTKNAIRSIYSLQSDGTVKSSYFNTSLYQSVTGVNSEFQLAKGLSLYAQVQYTWEHLTNKKMLCDEKGHSVGVLADLNYQIKPLKLNTRCTYRYDYFADAVYQGRYRNGLNIFYLTFQRSFLKGRMPIVFNILLPVDKFNDKRYQLIDTGYYRSTRYSSDIRNSCYAFQLTVQYYLNHGKSTRKSNHKIITDTEKYF